MQHKNVRLQKIDWLLRGYETATYQNHCNGGRTAQKLFNESISQL